MQHDVTEKCLDTNFSFTSIDHGDLSSCIFLMGKWNFEENILYRAVYWKTSLNGYIYMYILMMDKKKSTNGVLGFQFICTGKCTK